MIHRVKGMQDFCNLTPFNTVIDQFKKIAHLYTFSEIMTPILESFELFHRSLGTHTDVVSKEMFFIEMHDTDKEKICLRPEATASTMRSFLENGIQEVPWKVFSYGPMFRYERPQKGRFRQFHQINIEIIGTSSLIDDVQLIIMLHSYFTQFLGLSDFTLALNYLGCTQDRARYTSLLVEFLKNNSALICSTCITRTSHNPLRIFDCKVETCRKRYTEAPVITDYLCLECNKEWESVKSSLYASHIPMHHDTHLVRGLDYYNKTVFEFKSIALGSQNAFCGGGRYDSLGYEIGGKKDYPSIGAAIGIERVLLLLEQNQVATPSKTEKLCAIIPLSEQWHLTALHIATMLRSHAITTDLYTTGSTKSMMRKAGKDGMSHALLIGDDEGTQNSVTVKNMVTGEQQLIKQNELIDYLQKT